jgi:predicted nucleic acid-binding protein
LLTSSAVLGAYGNPPLTNSRAWAVYQAFLADDRIGPHAEEPMGLEVVWKKLALRPTASPTLWMDAYLAAFAKIGPA